MEKRRLLHEALTEKIIGAFFDVHSNIGYGHLESLYQRAMPMALRRFGLSSASEVRLTVRYRGEVVGDFRADLIVENKIIVEAKAVAALHPVHELQLFSYLKAANLRVGLLLNFGPRATFRRLLLPESAMHGGNQQSTNPSAFSA